MPRDMQFFRRTTAHHVVVMGRNTFESLGCRPLPRRINIVLSTTQTYEGKDVFVARNLDNAIDIARAKSRRERMFVIGGGSVYDQVSTLADELYLTQIEPYDPSQASLFDDFYGDTFFPKIRGAGWDICHVSRRYRAIDSLRPRWDVSPSAHYFRFFKYTRRSSGGCSEREQRQVRSMLERGESIAFPIRPTSVLVAARDDAVSFAQKLR
jgi:dihydrofolate reductase